MSEQEERKAFEAWRADCGYNTKAYDSVLWLAWEARSALERQQTQQGEALTELVFTALGEASMCWSEIPKGVFESTKAKAIGDRLIAALSAQQAGTGWNFQRKDKWTLAATPKTAPAAVSEGIAAILYQCDRGNVTLPWLIDALRGLAASTPSVGEPTEPDQIVHAINCEIDTWEQVPDHFHGAMKRKIEAVVRAAVEDTGKHRVLAAAPTPDSKVAPDMRDAFEADYLKRFRTPGYLGRDKDGNYGHLVTRGRWEGWQAALAAHPSPAANGAAEVSDEQILSAWEDYSNWAFCSDEDRVARARQVLALSTEKKESP